jgi:hypothetical protein
VNTFDTLPSRAEVELLSDLLLLEPVDGTPDRAPMKRLRSGSRVFSHTYIVAAGEATDPECLPDSYKFCL